jgi:hypothetical protein
MAFTITKPLGDHQAEEVIAVNQLASDKILLRYPLYKQLNTARTEQAQAMYDWIDSIRLASNNAQDAIVLAVSVTELRSITLAFTQQLALL